MSGSASVSTKWGWFLLLGIIMLAAGVFAVGHPLVTTLVGVLFVGASLLVGGIFQVIQSALAKEWSNFGFGILAGLLSIIGGVLIMQEPAVGSLVITIMLLVALALGGLLRVIIAIRHTDVPLWWLVALGGLVSIGVGVALYMTLPWSSLWILGTLIGIELIFEGVGWIAFSLSLRNHGKAKAAAAALAAASPAAA